MRHELINYAIGNIEQMKEMMTCLLVCLIVTSVAADEKPNTISVATWNLEWFFDDYTGDNSSDLSKKQSAPSREEWQWKLNNAARVVGEMKPTILALQEVENRQVIRQLTRKLKDQYQLSYRIAYIEGWDNFTEQDVAIIYRGGLVQYSCREQTADMFSSKEFYNLNKHLFATFEWGEGEDKESLTMLTVHLRAMPEKHDLRQKQVKLIRAWIGERIERGENVIVLGDFNSEETAEQIQPNSDLAILSGWTTGPESDDLFDLHNYLEPRLRDTHMGGKQFDRIFASRSVMEDAKRVKDLSFSRVACFKDLVIVGERDNDHFNKFYDIPQAQRDVSDHYPVMAEFLFK